MIIYIDIDDTICTGSVNGDYAQAVPIPDAIARANSYYDAGHTVIYWTARGTVTRIDWRELTELQFATWGVKYHDLKFGKPAYDLFIDDKNINSQDWSKFDLNEI
jgi:CMP-N,N'-diacetyllegionaminic acid synthase